VFLKKHPRASAFHSSPWLKALKETYDYPVIGYTTSAPDRELENAMVFCKVESWLTGRRLVSLPFSDHCQPLVDRAEDLQTLLAALEQETKREKWRYVEVRPITVMEVRTTLHLATENFSFHELDLRPDVKTLFANLHKDSIQRKIRRAEREKLSYEEGRSEELLNEFYKVFTMTRRRHYRPPQPKKWFRNLMNYFGDALKIRVARKNGRPVAVMMTVQHKDTMVYKYGGSDARYNHFGGMHLLYWTTIREAKDSGLRCFDLGRTDDGQSGLVKFKNRWGATESRLTYSRFGLSEESRHRFERSPSKSAAKGLLAHAPDKLLSFLGENLYKHVG
jgi:CelD/BcsL family acetyltransferase involved in cellulose biosynthesis